MDIVPLGEELQSRNLKIAASVFNKEWNRIGVFK